jgi:hypothetical protein
MNLDVNYSSRILGLLSLIYSRIYWSRRWPAWGDPSSPMKSWPPRKGLASNEGSRWFQRKYQ